MVDWATINVRKIYKALYLILESYHRALGLAVMAWSKAPGNCYYSFYSLAVRDSEGRPRHLPEVYGRYSLTIYQHKPGLPGWGAGDQIEHAEWRQRELRSDELVNWYLGHLTLSRFFAEHASEIARWRQTYTVALSEPFLYSWNILGLCAAHLNLRIGTFGRSDDGWGLSEVEKQAADALSVPWPEEAIQVCGELAFCTDGRVLLPNGQIIHVWQEHLHGRETADIVNALVIETDRS